MRIFLTKVFLVVVILTIPLIEGFTQENSAEADSIAKIKYYELVLPTSFAKDVLTELVLKEINKSRSVRGLDSLFENSILKNAAEDQAQYMTSIEGTSLLQGGKKKTTGKRVVYYGGADYADEFVTKMPAKKGKEYYTYKKVAEDIAFKLLSGKKSLTLLIDSKYIFVGLGFAIDEFGKKVYVSLVLGNYQSMNEGAARKEELEIPFATKKYGLKSYNQKICKNCLKFKNIEELQKGLYLEDGLVYFKYDNLKALKRLIKKPKDGLAVDVVQKDQFLCQGNNIVDNNTPYKGVLTKKVWINKLLKKNLITDKKERKKKIDVCLGKYPKTLIGKEDECELNLVVIQNKHVCKNIAPSYNEEINYEYENKIDLLADTVTFGLISNYIPQPTSTILNFKIPFEQGKSTYNPADIEAFLTSLNEPDFVIDELKLFAYSSIEGTNEVNKRLQVKRAESIIEALRKRQQFDIVSSMTTNYCWDKFKTDVQGTQFSNMASMTLEEAQESIRKNNLHKKLETILKNHRYAEMQMKVTYDISGAKEQPYVVKMFNDAVAAGNMSDALMIQKYIFKQVLAEKYTDEAVHEQNIGESYRTAGLLMNKLWLEKYVNKDELNEDYCGRIAKLNQLASSNAYIQYNNLYCNSIHNGIGNETQISATQQEIVNLYESTLSKGTVDLLNLEFQFAIINTLDTLEDEHPLITESLQRIKQIVNLDEAGWQNSLKLAYIFIEHEDYEFAVKLLEPFVVGEDVNEDFIFTYISLCSRYNSRMGSYKFGGAMKKAQQINSSRYCQLINDSKLSFQVFENKQVKDDYYLNCQ